MSDARTHTGLHVLKGAVQSVLGAKTTTSTFVSDRHGRLTVSFGRKPTDEELERIEQAANAKVSEGAEVLEFEMERAEAESHFGKEIYDAFPVPQEIVILKIVRIPDWNVNSCAEEHSETTSEVGRFKLGRARFRNARGELELEFDLLD